MAQRIAGRQDLGRADRALIAAAQRDFPLVARPYQELAGRVGSNEEEVIARLAALKQAGLIRRIGPVLEPRALGLISELVAVEVDPSELDSVAAEVSAWPPVTHCYSRDHRVNLWFAAVASDSFWFGAACATAKSLPGVMGTWRLPALRRFKIGVRFDLDRRTGGEEAPPASWTGGHAVTEDLDQQLLGAVQQDLPLCPAPFGLLASSAGITEGELLETLRGWQESGLMRRYGALVNHLRLGFTANAMTVWLAPPDNIEQAARWLSRSPQVSHCYERPAFPGFPHNLYAMVHGLSREECLRVVTALSEEGGIGVGAVLFSIREYKKSAPDYLSLLASRSRR